MITTSALRRATSCRCWAFRSAREMNCGVAAGLRLKGGYSGWGGVGFGRQRKEAGPSWLGVGLGRQAWPGWRPGESTNAHVAPKQMETVQQQATAEAA